MISVFYLFCNDMTLKDYITQAGRGSITYLAKEIKISVPIVFNWANGKRQVPAERCPDIERITKGLVTCEELRPDVNWAVLRNSEK